MTKAQEIDIIQDAIQKLGDDSYIGPWLKSVVAEVEQSIRSDFFPTILPSETQKQCAEMRKEASQHAKHTIELAEAKRSEIVKDAETKAEIIRINIRRDLEKALNII
jgi:cell division septum initiation protein DivIVA